MRRRVVGTPAWALLVALLLVVGVAVVEVEGATAELTDIKVMEWNILASDLADNTRPYFLYDSRIGKDAQQRELDKFSRRSYKFEDLARDAQQRVQQYDAKYFKWDKRASLFQKAFEQHKPDIVILAEDDQQRFFTGALPQYDMIYKQRPGGPTAQAARRSDGSAIFWKKDGFVAERSGMVDYEDNDRCFVWAILRLNPKNVERRLLVIGTHLMRNPEDPDRETVRLSEVKQIKKFIDEKIAETPQLHILIAGDFNAVPDSPSVDFVTRHIDRRLTNAYTYNAAATGLVGNAKVVTSATTMREECIDYVFSTLPAKGVVSLEPVDKMVKRDAGGTVISGIPDAQHPSDHIPVVTTLRWDASADKNVAAQPVKEQQQQQHGDAAGKANPADAAAPAPDKAKDKDKDRGRAQDDRVRGAQQPDPAAAKSPLSRLPSLNTRDH